MIFKTQKELKKLKKRVETLESKLEAKEDREDNGCSKCGMDYIETSQMSGASKTFLCPRCGNQKSTPWPDLELR